MSNLIFPQLKGVGWGSKLTPQFSNGKQAARSGRSVRAKFRNQPLTKISIVYSGGSGGSGYLSDSQPPAADDGSVVFSDFETMYGFFCSHGGDFESFLFQGANQDDAKKFARSGELQFVGDGATTDFQLLAHIGIWSQFVYWPQGLPIVYVSGAPVAVTALGNGMFRLGAAPAIGAPVTADFVFAFRCIFDAAEIDFTNWRSGYWSCDTPLITVKP
jgi:hypothetical protein